MDGCGHDEWVDKQMLTRAAIEHISSYLWGLLCLQFPDQLALLCNLGEWTRRGVC